MSVSDLRQSRRLEEESLKGIQKQKSEHGELVESIKRVHSTHGSRTSPCLTQELSNSGSLSGKAGGLPRFVKPHRCPSPQLLQDRQKARLQYLPLHWDLIFVSCFHPRVPGSGHWVHLAPEPAVLCHWDC